MVSVLDLLTICCVLKSISNWVKYCLAGNSTVILSTALPFTVCKVFINSRSSTVPGAIFTCKWRRWWFIAVSIVVVTVFYCSSYCVLWLYSDHHWYAAGEAVTEGHRSEAQRHYEAGKVYQRTSWHVHGHGDARRKPGLFILFLLFAEAFRVNLLLLYCVYNYMCAAVFICNFVGLQLNNCVSYSVCSLAVLRENSYSCCCETLRIDRQWYWGHAYTFW